MNLGLSLGLGAALALPTDAENFGSVMFPFENGRTTDTAKNGQFLVNNFRTQASGPGSAAPFWQGPYAAVAICDPHRARVDGQNFPPCIMGTDANLADRSFVMNYSTNVVETTANRRTFAFGVRGEAAPGTWLMRSAQIPLSARGPFAVYAYNDDINGYIHVLDIPTGTWYDGAAVAKPASWAGVSAAAFTNNLVVGGTGQYTFPADNSASFQNALQWRGSIGDILFANDALSKADVESIVNGASPVTVATTAGATAYCHIPMTSGGALSTSANTTFTGISLTQQGTVFPGGTLRRQSTANYITLDPINAGEHFPVAFGSTQARIRIKGKVGGLTGTLRWRLVRPNGNAITNWVDTGITPVAGAFDGHVTTTEFTGKAQIQVAMSSDMTVIGSSHVDCQSGPVIEIHAQSEANFSLGDGRTAQGDATTLNPTISANGDTVLFGVLDGSVRSALDQPGWLGNGSVALINYIRSKTGRSIMVRVNAVDGTSPLALMNDADTTRNWSDLVIARNFVQATGASGESVVTGHVVFGWEASLSPTNVMPVAYKPLLTGVGASSGTYDRTSNIPTANVNRWLFDGSSSANAKVVITPCNRATTGTGATDTDASIEADQRDHFRNYSHLYNYEVGPEMTAHRMEGETAAGGLPTGSVTRPEPNVWEGGPEGGIVMAEAVLEAAGIGTYPGPVFFESVVAGTAANKVKVRLGQPRPNPGQGLAEGVTGYNTAPQSGSYTYALHVKKTGGNAGAGFEARIRPSGGAFGAWSKANVTSGTITDAATGEVELTLSASLSAGDTVEILYLPGSTGRYAAGTITQENWRSGLLYFTGTTAPASLTGTADLIALGWQVAGSNQALTYTL